MDLVSTQVLDLAIADDVTTAVTGSLIGAQVGLFQNDITPLRTSVVGDFTQATYTGYALANVTWSAPSVSDGGDVELIGTVPEFRPDDAVTPNTVFGFLLVDGAGAYIMGARFDDPPLPMGSALDVIIVTVRVRIPSGGIASIVT